jgi:hypothetical protein
MKFKQKAFWIHNAVAEVWFCLLVVALRSEANSPAWLYAMTEELEQALEADWIDGVTSSIFDTHLVSTDRVKLFLPRARSTTEELLLKASENRSVSIGRFNASSSFLIPEMQMVNTLLFRPEEVSEPWKVFTLRDGWRVA